MQLIDPVPDRGHVRRAVAVAAIAFAQDQRKRIPVPAGKARREGAERTVADCGDPSLLQVAADSVEHRVVEALRSEIGVGERDAEPAVYRVVVLLAVVNQHPPQPKRLSVAGLERYHPLA